MLSWIGRRLAIVLVLIGLGGSVALAQSTTRWDMWVAWPHTNYVTQAMIRFADLVEERTDGQLVIQVHPGGALGYKGPEVLGAVEAGAIPIAEIFMPNMEGAEPIFGLATMPIPAGYEESERLYEIALPHYEEALERHNSKLLLGAVFGTTGLYIQELVEEPQDQRAVTVRTASAGSTALAEAAGFRAMTIPWGEVHSALSTGLVNSVLTSPLSGVDGAFWEVTDHFYNELFPTSTERDLLIVNSDAFDQLPEDVQQVLIDTAAEIEEEIRTTGKQVEEDALATLRDHGMNIISREAAPQWLVEAVEAGSEEVVNEWAERAGDAAQAVVDEFRSTQR